MTYIYDIILNFTDKNYFYDFFEWIKEDNYINVRKSPIFRVSSKAIYDICNYKVRIDSNFLNVIKDKSLLYKKDRNNFSNIVILSNREKAIGISINNNGYVEYVSSLLLDEELDACRIIYNSCEYNLKYKKYSKISNNFILRDSINKKNYLQKEIKKLYKNKKYNKLQYLYYEVFNKVNDNIEELYNKLLNSLNNYSKAHDNIYNFLKEKHSIVEK